MFLKIYLSIYIVCESGCFFCCFVSWCFSVLFFKFVWLYLVVMLSHRLFDFARCSTIWIQLLRFFSPNWLRQIRVCLSFITHIPFRCESNILPATYMSEQWKKKTESFRYTTGNIFLFFHPSTVTISYSFGTNDGLTHTHTHFISSRNC